MKATCALAVAFAIAGCTRPVTFSDSRGGSSSLLLTESAKASLATRVLRLTRPGAADSPALGSAVLLDDGTVLTNLHNLPPASYGYLMRIDGRWVQTSPSWVSGFELAGQPVALRLIKKGGQTPQEMSEDWAVLEVKPEGGSWPPSGSDAIKICLGELPSPGTEVLMVGYWSPSGDLKPSSPTFVRGTVESRSVFGLPKGVFVIHSDDAKTTLEGTSGGAIATIDLSDASITIVGIYRGMRIASMGASEVARAHLGVVPCLDR